MILRMHFYADPILRKKCTPIKHFTEDLKAFVDDMIETLDAYNAIGVAAPQVGKPLRIFVTRKEVIKPDGTFDLGKATVYINPVLSNPSDEEEETEEGCLSLPGAPVSVSRPVEITVEAFDVKGEKFTERLKGLDARAVMHENDHINGVLMIDRCSNKEKARIQNSLRALKKKYKHTYS